MIEPFPDKKHKGLNNKKNFYTVKHEIVKPPDEQNFFLRGLLFRSLKSLFFIKNSEKGKILRGGYYCFF